MPSRLAQLRSRLALRPRYHRRVIWGSALAAALARFPGALWPIRPDEAGFLLVARAWDPQPDSVYGTYWVDRPPLLIAVVKLADAIGGPYFLRFVAALGCILLVVASAAVARHIGGARAAPWAAIATAAVTANAQIDPIAAKGEILGIPLIMTSIWWVLLALERKSWRWAAAAGFLASAALGLKQNMVAGLVFGAVLLFVAWRTGRLTTREFLTLGLAGGLAAGLWGLSTPVWALANGVELDTLLYQLYGFRGDAITVLAEGSGTAPGHRAAILALVVVTAGIAAIVGGFLAHLPSEWKADPATAAATLAVVVVDGAGLILGGSFWRPYLFLLVPATALCAAGLAHRRSRRGLAMRAVIGVAVVSAVMSLLAWTVGLVLNVVPPTEARTGEALAAVAAPGDDLVVFGGRADIQWESGMPSPYEHLWSLPMRTLDPDYDELVALLEGPDAPTWVVEWIDFDDWGAPEDTARLRRVVHERYELHGFGCDYRPVFLLEGLDRDYVNPTCDR